MKLAPIVCAAILAVGFTAAAQAACVYPQAPESLPNGSSASKDEMLAAQGKVKEYKAAVEEQYLPCLEKEKTDAIAQLSTADAAAYQQQKASIEEIHAKKHNAAVDELTAVAARWSDELKAYSAKSKQ